MCYFISTLISEKYTTTIPQIIIIPFIIIFIITNLIFLHPPKDQNRNNLFLHTGYKIFILNKKRKIKYLNIKMYYLSNI